MEPAAVPSLRSTTAVSARTIHRASATAAVRRTSTETASPTGDLGWRGAGRLPLWGFDTRVAPKTGWIYGMQRDHPSPCQERREGPPNPLALAGGGWLNSLERLPAKRKGGGWTHFWRASRRAARTAGDNHHTGCSVASRACAQAASTGQQGGRSGNESRFLPRRHRFLREIP